MLRRVHISVERLRALQGKPCQQICRRGMTEGRRGCILGAWDCCDKNKFTQAASAFNDELGGKLAEVFKRPLKEGEVDVVHDLGGFYAVALCGLGSEGRGFHDQERIHECRESVRRAVAVGYNVLMPQACCTICVDPMTCPDAAAEGAKLAGWMYQEFKTPPRIHTPEINLFSNNPQEKEVWDKGSILADAQNTSRFLSELPANVLTPKKFAEEAIRILCPCGVHVEVRPLLWIERNKMFSFLNIARGSCEMPYFLEINYCGGSEGDRPVVLIGKGVTYDSGGLCLKKCISGRKYKFGDMAERKASCNGAASIIGAIKALARFGVPVNVVGLIPLFENMIGGTAIKPGDVLMALNGRTILVEDTDHEGRLAIADTLVYSDHFKPCLDVVIGNLSLGVRTGLGTGATATFSSSQVVWEELDKAGATTGDRVWRLPLWNNYKKRVTSCVHVDCCNTGAGAPDGNPCMAAAFLKLFVPGCDYLQLDTTGTGLCTKGRYAPYLRTGFMTGRPTRTIAQFVNNMACPLDVSQPCSGV